MWSLGTNELDFLVATMISPQPMKGVRWMLAHC